MYIVLLLFNYVEYGRWFQEDYCISKVSNFSVYMMCSTYYGLIICHLNFPLKSLLRKQENTNESLFYLKNGSGNPWSPSNCKSYKNIQGSNNKNHIIGDWWQPCRIYDLLPNFLPAQFGIYPLLAVLMSCVGYQNGWSIWMKCQP